MKTTFHKGDVVRTTHGTIKTITEVKPGLYWVSSDVPGSSGWSGCNTLTLIRRSTEPEFPSHLPPLLDAPEGKHWVYRGRYWFTDSSSPIMWYDEEFEVWEPIEDGPSLDVHYAELVDNEPYIPPLTACRCEGIGCIACEPSTTPDDDHIASDGEKFKYFMSTAVEGGMWRVSGLNDLVEYWDETDSRWWTSTVETLKGLEDDSTCYRTDAEGNPLDGEHSTTGKTEADAVGAVEGMRDKSLGAYKHLSPEFLERIRSVDSQTEEDRLRSRVTELEAACAAKDAALKGATKPLATSFCRLSNARKDDEKIAFECATAKGAIEKALSPDAGKGWLSPNEAADLQSKVTKLEYEKEQWQDGRQQGRIEALEILMESSAEDFEDFLTSYPMGDTGDYGTSWDAEKLRNLFRCDERHSWMDRLIGYYWELQAYKDGFTAAPGWLSPEDTSKLIGIINEVIGQSSATDFNQGTLHRVEAILAKHKGGEG